MDLYSYLDNIRNKNPLVHCITNVVSINDCANILLASGASPFMSQDIREVEESVVMADSLVCNMGNIEHSREMLLASKKANKLAIPVVLDPVAVGGTSTRREFFTELKKEIKITAICGNASEIKYIAGKKIDISGVDAGVLDEVSDKNIQQNIDMIKKLSKELDCIIILSGKIDLISNGNKTIILKNGCYTMSKITGSGCMLTSLIGASVSVNRDSIFEACVAAVALMGISGEIAEEIRVEKKLGNMSFKNHLIDSVYNMKREDFERKISYEIR